ncbi:MAG TPA: hypothetical protein VGL18_11680 [Actinomycetota bacterium]
MSEVRLRSTARASRSSAPEMNDFGQPDDALAEKCRSSRLVR